MATNPTTPEAFVDYCTEHGVRVEFVTPLDGPDEGINVWADPRDRYAADTVWFFEKDITWGPKFEYVLRPDTTPKNLFEAVMKTIKEKK